MRGQRAATGVAAGRSSVVVSLVGACGRCVSSIRGHPNESPISSGSSASPRLIAKAPWGVCTMPRTRCGCRKTMFLSLPQVRVNGTTRGDDAWRCSGRSSLLYPHEGHANSSIFPSLIAMYVWVHSKMRPASITIRPSWILHYHGTRIPHVPTLLGNWSAEQLYERIYGFLQLRPAGPSRICDVAYRIVNAVSSIRRRRWHHGR